MLKVKGRGRINKVKLIVEVWELVGCGGDFLGFKLVVFGL